MTTRSRLLIRQSVPPVIVTRTRRGAVVALLKGGLPVQYVGGLMVAALMLGGLASAAWLVAYPAQPVMTAAEIREAEDRAFKAGRETAYEELSQGMAKVYEQGRVEGRLEAADAMQRGGVR